MRQLECRLHLAGARVALRRIGLQRALDDLHERVRQVGSSIVQVRDASLLVQPGKLAEALGLDGVAVRDEVVEQHAQAVDVALNGRGSAGEDLRRKIERRPRDAWWTVYRQITALPGAEIHQDDASAFLTHDVLRLDVAMQKS